MSVIDTVYQFDIPVSVALLGDLHGRPYQEVLDSCSLIVKPESGGQSPSDSFGGPGRGSGFSVLPCFRARCFNDLNCEIVQTDTIFVLEN